MRAFKLIFAHFLLALILISAFSTGLTASAEYSYDVDFSIKPDKTEVRAGDDLKVDIVVTTRRSGYVAFDFVLNYDESYFTCLTTTFDKDGYKGDGTAVGKFSINYKDPSTSEHPEPTKRDKDYTIRLDFKVNSVEKAGSSNLKGKVSKLNGVNSLD
ncbi:MAG: hypothetical protein LBS74_10860, partial [Oscillospiraceae bacterium]|nr:hypothetical protein [Oscillospiraceae bacterium]